jgi:hypothetical protein
VIVVVIIAGSIINEAVSFPFGHEPFAVPSVAGHSGQMGCD